jgi:hypothetical protein
VPPPGRGLPLPGRVTAKLLRAGWPWRLPARAPTDPDVRALTHPVLQPTALPSRKGPRGYPSTFRGQAAEPRCAPPVSRARVCQPTLRFPPQGPPGRVPLLRRYYQSATTSCRSSRRTSLPSFGGTSACTRSVRSPADECAAGAWSWSPGSSGRDYRRGDGRISQVPGEPRLPVCRVQSTLAGLRAPDRYSAAAWPLVCEQQRLPREVFRRSIARRSGSLSTLRRADYPAPTQDSLPAVGQTLLDGLLTRRAPTKGFRGVVVTSLPPFPSLLGAITSTAGTCGVAGFVASSRITPPLTSGFVSPASHSAADARRGHSFDVAILLSPSARERLRRNS